MLKILQTTPAHFNNSVNLIALWAIS